MVKSLRINSRLNIQEISKKILSLKHVQLLWSVKSDSYLNIDEKKKNCTKKNIFYTKQLFDAPGIYNHANSGILSF